MECLNSSDIVSILNLALKDKNINNYEFRILTYICFNSDFMVSEIKEDLRISSFNMVSKFLKNLVSQGYIIKESKKTKNIKNVSSYIYFINTQKLSLQKNDNIAKNSLFADTYELFYYFFEKIPTTQKVDKSKNLKSIDLLLNLDNYEINYVKELIDFSSKNEKLKNLYNRPLSFRKNIKEIIALYDEQKQNI